jgi:Domain of Unknown Function (DUF1259)
MRNLTLSLSRRQALVASVGAIGTLAALASPPLSVLADQTSAPESNTQDHPGGSDRHDSKRSDWEKVAAVFNQEPNVQPGDVLLVDLPRSDFQTTLFGVPVLPDFATDTMITFQHTDDAAIVKWEFVLLDSEVDPVMDALFGEGLRPATTTLNALHNHWLKVTPEIKYLHGTARGDALTMARALRDALSHSGTPFNPSEPPGSTGLPNDQIAQIVGGTGMVSDNVLVVDVDRRETIVELGVRLEPAMEVDSEAVFQAIGGGQAAVQTEIVVLAEEADAVARQLRAGGLFVTALHNHELVIEPRLYYVHAFGTGEPLTLAHAVRAALNHTNSKFES